MQAENSTQKWVLHSLYSCQSQATNWTITFQKIMSGTRTSLSLKRVVFVQEMQTWVYLVGALQMVCVCGYVHFLCYPDVKGSKRWVLIKGEVEDPEFFVLTP